MRYLLLLLLVGCAASIPSEEGTINVYFCPEECADQLEAWHQLYPEAVCALHSWDPKVLSVNPQQVLLDHKNDDGPGTSVYTYGLMHHKFCLLDEDLFWTGSMNPTRNGVYKNNNNLLLINSSCLARNYGSEWFELEDGRERRTLCPMVNLSGVLVENAFCPEDDCLGLVLKRLGSAEKSIRFMAFSFTHPEIASLLIEKHKSGVLVEGVLEKRMQSHTVYPTLLEAGIDVQWDTNPATMHHKVFVIDEKIVITGSMNPTKSGVRRNEENLLIIHDEVLAHEFLDEFDRIWFRASPVNDAS